MKATQLMNTACLYLEINESSLKLLNGNEPFEFTLEREQNGRLTEACKQKLTAGLQGFLERKNWQPRLRALCAIGARGVLLRRLTLPASTKEELLKLLRLQIESEFPLPPEQLAWGYQPLLKNGSGKQEVLVVAVKKESVEEYSEILSACGVSAVFTLAAFARSLVCPQLRESYAVLDIGPSRFELVFFENGAPTSIRIVSWGDETITQSIAEELNVSHEEAEKLKLRSEGEMAGELAPTIKDAIGSALESLAGSINPKSVGQKLYLTGESGMHREIALQLSEYLGAGVKCEPIEIPKEKLSAAIAGLKKTEEGDNPRPLLVFQLNETKTSEGVAQSTPWKWAALAALFALILLFLPYAEAFLLKSRLAKKLSAIKADRGRLEIIDRELNFLQDLKKNQSPYLDTAYLMANSAPPGTRFDSFSMNRRGEISMKGNMANGQQVTDFRSKLIGSGFFSSVVVDEQTPTPDRQKVAVRISAQWKPAAGRRPVVVDAASSKTEKPRGGAKETISSPTSANNSPSPTNTSSSRREVKP